VLVVGKRQTALTRDQPLIDVDSGKACKLKLSLTLALVAIAIVLASRAFISSPQPGELAFFYDPSARSLFTAPSSSIPPIKGIDGDEEDAVRAVVISTSGNPADRKSREIAYLETYSPELKRQMEEARARGTAPMMSRSMALAHRFVRRIDNPQWHPLHSPEAEKILNAWLTAGPEGRAATICTP
jgi:hypothetical protein